MPDENTETGVRGHLSNKQTWLRLLYLILFGIVFEILKYVVFLVAAVQFLFKLFSGDVQPQIQRLGAGLAEYLRQIVEFLTFHTEDRPYPWGAWPMPDRGRPAEAVVTPADDEAPPAKTAASRGRRGSRRKGGGDSAPE